MEMNGRVLMSWFVCFAAMAAWGVAEWMLAKETVRVCRDDQARLFAKIFAATTVLVDVLVPCSFLVAAACSPVEDGCHLVEWQDFWRIGVLLALTPILSLFFGISVLCFAFVDLFAGLDMFRSYAELGMTALLGVYSAVWAFMRGAIILRAPRRPKWRTAFVCLVTYWLVVVQLFVL